MNTTPQFQYGLADRADFASKPGIEVLKAIISGEFPQPPIAQALTFWLVEVGEGFAAFEGQSGYHLLNPSGGVHGGWGLTLIDSATGCAAFSLLPAGVGFTTVETKANFTRPITQDTGLVRCEGKVINQGRRIITTESTITSAEGKLLAHGTSTIMVLESGK